MSANITPQKAFKARLGAIVKSTEEFDAPLPPRPAPEQVPYPFSRDIPHNPFGFRWTELVPDLSVLDGCASRDADLSGLRFVSRMELGLMRRAPRSFLRQHPVPVGSNVYLIVRVDSRRRFATVTGFESTDHAYLTTAPYPSWMCDEHTRNKALAELALAEAGI